MVLRVAYEPLDGPREGIEGYPQAPTILSLPEDVRFKKAAGRALPRQVLT